MIDWFQQTFGLGRWKRVFGSAQPRSREWPEVTKAYKEFVPPICPFDGTTRVQLHHSKAAFHQDPSQELNPMQLRWVCEGLGTHNHHIILGHAGNFQSLWKDLDTRIEFFQHRPLWNGKEWVPTNTYNIKYKLTEADLEAWNKRFGTNWTYE